jgi:hypothetical protein
MADQQQFGRARWGGKFCLSILRLAHIHLLINPSMIPVADIEYTC